MGLMSYVAKGAMKKAMPKVATMAMGGARGAMDPQMAARLAEMQGGLTLGMAGGGVGAGAMMPTLMQQNREDAYIPEAEQMNEELRRMLEEQRMERMGMVPPKRFQGR